MVRRFPILTIGLLLVAIAFLPAPLAARVQYDRAIGGAEGLLRMLGCQWAHWSVDHFVWDAAVFAVLGIVCERRCRGALVATLLLCTITIPSAVHWLCPQIVWFRGLSGVDCGLFGLLLSWVGRNALRRRDTKVALACATVLAMFIAKIGYESIASEAVFVRDGSFTVVALAHAIGTVIGLLVGALPIGAGGRLVGAAGDGYKRDARRDATDCIVRVWNVLPVEDRRERRCR